MKNVSFKKFEKQRVAVQKSTVRNKHNDKIQKKIAGKFSTKIWLLGIKVQAPGVPNCLRLKVVDLLLLYLVYAKYSTKLALNLKLKNSVCSTFCA